MGHVNCIYLLAMPPLHVMNRSDSQKKVQEKYVLFAHLQCDMWTWDFPLHTKQIIKQYQNKKIKKVLYSRWIDCAAQYVGLNASVWSDTHVTVTLQRSKEIHNVESLLYRPEQRKVVHKSMSRPSKDVHGGTAPACGSVSYPLLCRRPAVMSAISW